MARLIVIIVLLAQVLATTTAFAAPRCVDMDMAQTPHAAGGHDTHAAGDDATAPHCKCLCNVVGHCTGSAAGTIDTVALTAGFAPVSVTLSAPTDRTASAHRNRHYRPPSSS